MSYPEFSLCPSPEAWMNGWILSPPPFFSLTFQASLLLSGSLSFKLPHPLLYENPGFILFCFLFLSLTLQPPTFTVSFSCPLFVFLLQLCLPSCKFYPLSLFLSQLFERVFFPTMVRSKPVSIVRGGPLVLFTLQTLTHHRFPLHWTSLSVFILFYFRCLFPSPPKAVSICTIEASLIVNSMIINSYPFASVY